MATEAQGGSELIGQTVGNWRLSRLLGQGAFGAVYEAENTQLTGRRAAVKVLHAQMALNADIKRRFVNEASAASRASNEHIITIYDCGVTPEGLCFVIMELLEGKTLTDIGRIEGRFSLERTIDVGIQIADALGSAHSIGVIHRDLKPDNVFITTRGTKSDFVKVLDFGVAKLLDEGVRTQTGALLGTPSFMSPDQWRGLKDLDGRADIYSLGCILFTCLTGQRPFKAKNPVEWMTAHLTHALPDMNALGVHPAMASVLAKMLAKQREGRQASMAEVIRDLEKVRSAMVSAPSDATLVSGALAPARAPAPIASDAMPTLIPSQSAALAAPRAPTSRPPIALLAAAFLFIAGLTASIVWLVLR